MPMSPSHSINIVTTRASMFTMKNTRRRGHKASRTGLLDYHNQSPDVDGKM
jgi:hypothetical protein